MVDFKSIQDKWQKKWSEKKVFEPKIDPNKEKFFITNPYPYISGSLHIGHARVVTETDVYSRFLRMKGKNVLYPMAFHISGTPVLGISLAIREGDEKKIKLYKGYVRAYVSDEKEVEKIVKSFEDPWNIVKFFTPKMVAEYSSLGLGVDWSRTFNSGDVEHQKLVEWQFQKYKEKGYLTKGSHHVLYCLKDENAVGEDDIQDGDTNPVKKQDFMWIKFKLKDSDLILMTGTTRPDALYGQTNLWVDPSATYKIVSVNNEKWVVGNEAVKKIKMQVGESKVVGEIKATELIGKWVKGPLVENELYILPADFIDASIGSGIVYSALEDPVDLLELKKLQSSSDLIKKYNLDEETVAKLKPIFIINVEGMGENLGEDIAKEFRVGSSKDKEKIEKAKAELNKRVFRKGVMKDNCGVCSGKSVQETQTYLKKHLTDSNEGLMFYELSREAKCRCGGEVVVATISGQWFLDFNAKDWKKQSKKHLDSMEIVPDKFRKQFEDVFDWLDKRPCARKRGLGTKFPFDQKWVIESLSDSTIYMSLYTIQSKIKEYKISGEKLTPAFFDYVFLGEGKGSDVPKNQLDDIRESFNYWYPNDHRHTFSAHLSNHLSFMIFAHVACFPKKFWPKKFTFHGMVLAEGGKMSKSKGNVVTLMEMNKEYGADTFRAFLCSSTSVESSMDWKGEEAEKTKKHLINIFNILLEMSSNKAEGVVSDKAFISRIERGIKKATKSLEGMDLRNYSMVVLYDFLREYNRVLKKGKEIPLINGYLLERWTKMLAPLVPHYAEEIWMKLGNKDFVSLASWPEFDESKIDEKAEFIEDSIATIKNDVTEIQRFAKVEKLSLVKIIVAANWKYDFIKKFKTLFEKEKNIGNLMKGLINPEHGKTISKLVQNLVKNPSKVPLVVLSQEEEFNLLNEHKNFFEKELGCNVQIDFAEKSSEHKSGNAMPSKPAIVVS
jgi:leucyl-tRNA synthetase